MNPSVVLIETPDTRVELSSTHLSLLITIEGQLNEDTSLTPVLDYIQAIEKRSQPVETVEFDLGKLRKMNSCGVREWLHFLEKVSMNRKSRFLDLSETFVELASMIRNIMGKTAPEVVQFQAPYFCPRCDTKHTVHLRPKDVIKTAQGLTPPEQKCPACSQPLDFDSIESEYFAFLKQLKREPNVRT